MCHLRGILMLKLNRGDQAKQCFMEALALDVKCYDAFDQLVTGEMMTPDEGYSRFSPREDSLTPRFRMGICTRTSICFSDTSRCTICPAHIYRSSKEVQTCH